MKLKTKQDYRRRRHRRVRRKIRGTAGRPRAAIMRSNKHMQVQFVDDDREVTLMGVSTEQEEKKSSMAAAAQLGKRAAAAALEKGIKRVVVDRGGLRFHGRVRALVDAMVEAGIEISAKQKQDREAT